MSADMDYIDYVLEELVVLEIDPTTDTLADSYEEKKGGRRLLSIRSSVDGRMPKIGGAERARYQHVRNKIIHALCKQSLLSTFSSQGARLKETEGGL